MKVLLMPTVKCNRTCRYCYLHSKKTKKNVLSFSDETYHSPEEWMRGLKFVEKYYANIDSVDISGGEPFLYKDFTKLLTLLVQAYGRVNMTSNLDLMPDEFLDFPYKDMIWITVSYHLNDGELNWKILKSISRIADAGFRFSVNFVGEESQILLFEKVRQMMFQTFGAHTHLEPYIDYNSVCTFFGIPRDDVKRKIFLASITDGERKAIDAASERGVEEPSVISCGVSNEYMVVAENGDAYPCLGMMFEKRNIIGNIFRETEMSDIQNIECDIFCPCAQNYRDGFR